MKIRDHPNLVHWPPAWITPLGDDSLPRNKSEDLVLKKVELLPSPPHDYHNYIRLLADNRRYNWKTYRGFKARNTRQNNKMEKTYSSVIIFMRDLEFRDCLYQKLQTSIGQTLREIGDSEI